MEKKNSLFITKIIFCVVYYVIPLNYAFPYTCPTPYPAQGGTLGNHSYKINTISLPFSEC